MGKKQVCITVICGKRKGGNKITKNEEVSLDILAGKKSMSIRSGKKGKNL